jgi:putative restriction endonuclease
MPAITPATMIAALRDAVSRSGESAVLLAGPGTHPKQLGISGPHGPTTVWVYIWTLTFGGRVSLPDEWRIQMTTVQSPLALNPHGYTVLMGYEPDLHVFAGFDLSKHQRFTTGSPSVQIDKRVLLKALQDGLAFDRKDNDEIAVGLRPDQFMHYVRNAEMLHSLGADARTFTAMNIASSSHDVPAAELPTSEPRRRVVSEVSRWARDANFQVQVFNAYGNRCAVTRAQLKLVQAAHIIPVAAQGPDHVTNGILLSYTYHKAFDDGLIFLTPNYQMVLNQARADHLRQLGLDAGLQSFAEPLGTIHLPADPNQRPRPEFIAQANSLRQVG